MKADQEVFYRGGLRKGRTGKKEEENGART